MSFTGDLEHLPIVDVIQLLHQTRKTGTLCVKGPRGECQLVFNDGYISSANHANTSVRIGKILVDMQLISAAVCDGALAAQQAAGGARKPLIATLIEGGQLNKEDAFKGLKSLIEMTVVEMLRWTRGTFTLNVEATVISDEYRYFPEMLHQEINLDTQRVLMDALRIFDEQTRDGAYIEEPWSEESPPEGEDAELLGEAVGLSADDLGLGDLEQLERKIPQVFTSIEIVDPLVAQGRVVDDLLPGLAAADRQAFVDFLLRLCDTGPTGEAQGRTNDPARAVILCSRNGLTRYILVNFCKQRGWLAFTTDDERDLEPILDQSLHKGLQPLLIFGRPDEATAGWSAADLLRLQRQNKEKYPQVPALQLAAAAAGEFTRESYRNGVRAVLPAPAPLAEGGTSEAWIDFFESLLACIAHGDGEPGGALRQLKDELLALQGLRDAPEVSAALLRRVADSVERALTLIVRPGTLIAEKSVGVGRPKAQGVAPPLNFKVPLDSPSLLHKVLAEGRPYYGRCDDALIDRQLFAQIGAPHSRTVLLLPILSRGRAIALIYGDFGSRAAAAVPLASFEILAGQAGLVLENALYRRQLEKSPGPG